MDPGQILEFILAWGSVGCVMAGGALLGMALSKPFRTGFASVL